MKAAIRRIFVLAQATLAHRKTSGGRERPVVGDHSRNGVARSAVGAVGERISEAAIARGLKVAETIRAGGNVGRDGRKRPRFIYTFANDEIGMTRRVQRC